MVTTLSTFICNLAKGQMFSVNAMYDSEYMDSKKLRKRNNPYLGRVTKVTTFSGVRVCDYENMASTIEKREQGVEKKAPKYEWITFPYLAKFSKSEDPYLVVKPTKNSLFKTTYYVDGEEVTKEFIAPYLKKETTSSAEVLMVKVKFINKMVQGVNIWNR